MKTVMISETFYSTDKFMAHSWGPMIGLTVGMSGKIGMNRNLGE